MYEYEIWDLSLRHYTPSLLFIINRCHVNAYTYNTAYTFAQFKLSSPLSGFYLDKWPARVSVSPNRLWALTKLIQNYTEKKN